MARLSVVEWAVPILLVITLVACTAAAITVPADRDDESSPPPSGVPAEATVGPGGGTVAGETRAMVLVIPAGALDEEVTIKITPDTATTHPWAIAGTVYQFEPAGLEFRQPATLSIRYDPAQVTSSDPARGIALHRIDGDDWLELDSVVDSQAHTVSAELSGFSRYGVRAVAPTVQLNVGVVHPVTLVQLASASVRTNACIAGACDDIENESSDYPTELIPLFVAGNDDCGFLLGAFAGFLEDYFPTETDGDGGSAYAVMTAGERGNRAWFDFELNAFAQPVYRPGHNTTSTAVSHLSFLRLDHDAPGERRLVVDIDNPGGVTFDLAIAWMLNGGAVGVLNPHVQAASEVFLLGCGENWTQADRIDLYNAIASPLIGSDVEEAGVIRVRGLSDELLQLWVGLHVMVRARSVHGDDEGTIGYGLVDGGQAGVTGSFAVVAEVPQ